MPSFRLHTANSSLADGSDSLLHLYCRACNAVYTADISECPRCGIVVKQEHQLQVPETVLIPRDGTDTAGYSTEIQLDSMLLDGQEIHIYQCLRLLGRGGMGTVYLARNQRLFRHCALKILSPRQVSRDFDYVARFENEGRAAAALVHSNIVTTHAIGQWEQHHFLEMEYVAGSSLQAEIERCGPLGPIRSTSMAAGIASGLAAAHRMGIVHRDLKPDNVLVTPSNVPKIVDFGLAKRILGDDLPSTNLAGTPYFMAPELFEGAPASPVSDVFALGVCYYLMLTGCYPFEGSSIASLMHAILSGDYVSVRRRRADIPLEMAECVSLMLMPDPSQRLRDGAAASQLLQAVLGTVQDLDTLIYDAFSGLTTITCQQESQRFRVQLKLKDQRTQTIFIENSGHEASERLLMIYSICCESRPSFFEDALRLNASVHHGALAIRDVDGRACFVMVDTYPRATVSGEEIRRSVLEIGTQADHVERLLTGKDVH